MASESRTKAHALHQVRQTDTDSSRVQKIHRQISLSQKQSARESDVCSEGICDGSGEIATDELDTDSMQYMRGVGTEKCLCQILSK